ncbi:MAG: hypothetical protein R3E86_21615 [Pseudomonadales bacterium]
MLGSTIFIWVLAGALALTAHVRNSALHAEALRHAGSQLRMIALRVPLTLLAATYVLSVIPQATIVSLLGNSSGTRGILLANLFGAALPGGPMVTFPVIVVLRDHGVGDAQTVALLTSWSVLALHRVLAYELPLMGARFVAVRLLASALLPLLAGMAAGLLWTSLA